MMPKLIFVIDSLISGGAERVMSVLANKFSEDGYDTTIISKAHISSFYKLESRVKLVYLKTKVNYKNKATILFSRIRLYFDLYNYLKVTRPDVVIPFMTNTNGTVIIICKLLDLKVIASEHNNFRKNRGAFSDLFIKRVIYPHANLLTVLTERDKNEYYGRFMKNVTVMPNPLPLDPVENANPMFREKIILSVGELSRWNQKGFDLLLDIYAQIAPKYPEWKLVIAGSGNPEYLSGRIQKLGLCGSVSLIGEVTDIQTLMRKSSIFTLSSRWEGLPMVLLEAMSQGMACIAFDCFTGPRELITNRMNGILIEDRNINRFVSGLEELLDDQDLRLNLGTKAIETSKNYLPGKIMEKWIHLVKNTLNLHE
jgi:GalNAc-alpha-(1->4)-GalNAc-alpha-(1->3)-diNAcBac-PP-undecaprenol alpha-1,4-N-acetyl-D-galactosaminyltransferase